MPGELLPQRHGLGALYWNRGVAALIARDGSAFESMALGYQMRPYPLEDPAELVEGAEPEEGEEGEEAAPAAPDRGRDAAKLLVLAYRVSLADPGA